MENYSNDYLDRLFGRKKYVVRDALPLNIAVSEFVSELIASSLGPRGSYKLILDKEFGDFVTNDSGTIVNVISKDKRLPPVIQLILQAANVLKESIGDGVASMIIFGCELLKKAGELIEKGIHPNIIREGYKIALNKALEVLQKISFEIPLNNRAYIEDIMKNNIKSSFPENEWITLCHSAVDAISKIAIYDDYTKSFNVDLDYVKIVKVEGERFFDTQLVNGVIIDKKRLEPGVPKYFKDAKILLMNTSIKVENTRHHFFDSKFEFEIETPSHVKKLYEVKDILLRQKVEKIISIGANVVVSTDEIADKVIHTLAKRNVMAIRWVSKLDLKRIAKLTNAFIVSSLTEATGADLGKADTVEEVIINNNKLIVFKTYFQPRSVTFLVRGSNRLVIDEIERQLNKMLKVLKILFEKNRGVYGGGACEVTLSLELKKLAQEYADKRHIVIEKFAEALEAIPMHLARNAGLDPILTISALRKLHSIGRFESGIDGRKCLIEDMSACRIIDLLPIKENILKNSVEVVLMLLKVDEIIREV